MILKSYFLPANEMFWSGKNLANATNKICKMKRFIDGDVFSIWKIASFGNRAIIAYTIIVPRDASGPN